MFDEDIGDPASQAMAERDEPTPIDQEGDAKEEKQTFWMVGTPEELGKLFSAMAKARAEFPPIPKDAVGKIANRGGGYREFRYSSLTAVTNAIAGPLGKYEIAFAVFPVSSPINARATRLEYFVGHGNAMVRGTFAFLNPTVDSGAPQAAEKILGAVLTYLRRYLTKCIWSIEGDDDADQEPIENAAQPQQMQPPPRGRGRPPGSKNKPREQPASNQSAAQQTAPVIETGRAAPHPANAEQSVAPQTPITVDPSTIQPQPQVTIEDQDPGTTQTLGTTSAKPDDLPATEFQHEIFKAHLRALGMRNFVQLRGYVANVMNLKDISKQQINDLTFRQFEVLITAIRAEVSEKGFNVDAIESQAIAKCGGR